VKNISLFRINNIEFFVTGINTMNNMFICKLDSIINQTAGIGETTHIRCDLYMYTKDCNDLEIINAVHDIDLELQFNQNIWGFKRKRIEIPKTIDFYESIII
jgi:hypothetical protein